MLFSILAGTNAYMLLEHLAEIPLVIISDISGYFRDFEAAFPQHLFRLPDAQQSDIFQNRLPG
ncbi:hypothetical protein D3C75_1199180 [compost metagenome]